MDKLRNIFLNDIQHDKKIELPAMRIAVHLHAFYIDLIPEIAQYLCNIPVPFDLFISIPDTVTHNDEEIRQMLSGVPRLSSVDIRQTPNKGRDIAPMICTFGKELQKYDILLHLHTKRSPHLSRLSGWRQFLMEHLLLDRESVSYILSCLSDSPQDEDSIKAGIICAPDFIYVTDKTKWNGKANRILAQNVLDRNNLRVAIERDYPSIEFPQGTMFWCRADYLKSLFDIGLTYDDFDEEPIGTDGTIVHALERLFFIWGANTDRDAAKLYLSHSELVVQDLAFTREQKLMHRLVRIRQLIWLSALLAALLLFIGLWLMIK